MQTIHPRPDENGKPVIIKYPSRASTMTAWTDAKAAATVLPDGPMPPSVNGLAVCSWKDLPTTEAAWRTVCGQSAISEPPFQLAPGTSAAAGAVVLEGDGRVWLVSPSNQFAGYINTFPKGRVEGDISRQATAIREAYEESGLRVEITGFLADSIRTLTTTRYYLARRVGGNPADMGWETQAVHLVPITQLQKWLVHKNDAPLAAALNKAVDGVARDHTI